MASLFNTRTLAPLLQLTTTQIPTLEDLVPVVKLLKDDMVTDNMETVWQAGQDFKNGSWLGQVVLVDFSKDNRGIYR